MNRSIAPSSVQTKESSLARWVDPSRILTASLVAVVVVSIVAPFQYRQQTSMVAYGALATAAIASLWVTSLRRSGSTPGPSLPRARQRDDARALFRLGLRIGLVGTIIRYFDLIFIRGYSEYESATAFRVASLSESQAGASPIQIIGAGLSSVAVIPLLVILASGRHLTITRWQRTIAVAMYFSQMLYGVLRGGRAGVSFLLVTLAVAAALNPAPVALWRKNRRRLIALVILAGVVVVALSRSFLQDRIVVQGLSTVGAFHTLQDRHELVLDNPEVVVGPRSADAYVAISLLHYVAHAAHEFNDLVGFRWGDGKDLAWGSATFGPIARLIPGARPADRQVAFHQSGVYTTFLGPLYVDFGLTIAIGAAVAFAAYSRRSYRLALRGSVAHRLSYPLYGAVLFHAPVLNMLESANGLFPIGGVLASVGLISLRRTRLR